ncbi:succinate dehydrogenase, hydrophobic membrane anchor protein [Arenicella chitinivorans]|jgi:succinate dehydrogenase / fumarate reductase membrane anchor subunit|uniref:Succinate dehydrogenase hydrophobic membrane anchor subunit n=1 Tax=Arenicella chitinivorans TaxID=1329800 RepID=A0A918VLW8_9GAMM|nr:succinate dehydrogenase, hydrophobic membrane anchor protein [Arenicella chitinivorans]GHA09004.1 succinate dehydrogenase, hydrophobic membrane anchor protein [Arenicella chitinivorans]
MSLRSPLSKAVGLGSAKHGFSHWWWQRVSSVALIPLTLWFLYAVICAMSGGYEQAVAWLSSPINATIMLLFVLTSLFHAQTGLQVVIEDYVHTKWVNLTLLLSVKFAAVVMAVLAIISVLKIVLGG